MSETLLTVTQQADDGSISLYEGILTLRCVLEMNRKVKDAFPELPASWFQVFNERIRENRFTDQRLRDAVNHVIDTFVHGRIPNVGHFISYDRRISLYTQKDLDKLAQHDWRSVYKEYGLIQLQDGRVMYARREEIRKYALAEYDPVPAGKQGSAR